MNKKMIFVSLCCLTMLFTACSQRESISESSVTSEQETGEVKSNESSEIGTDDTIHPIENADPSIGAFGNELRHAYKDELVSVLNIWLDAHKNGTFEAIQNHHPAYPSDFPSTDQLPVIDSIEDVIVAWRESVIVDANTEENGVVYVIVPIDESHVYVLEPALFSDPDDNITLGFGSSSFISISADVFISQSEMDYWFGGK